MALKALCRYFWVTSLPRSKPKRERRNRKSDDRMKDVLACYNQVSDIFSTILHFYHSVHVMSLVFQSSSVQGILDIFLEVHPQGVKLDPKHAGQAFGR